MRKIIEFLKKHVVISAFTAIFLGAALVVIIEGIWPVVLATLFFVSSSVLSVLGYIVIIVTLFLVIRFFLRLEKKIDEINKK